MAKRKVVRRYTEEQFVTLLENIVNRVKEEQRLDEAKENRKKSLTEDFRRSNGRVAPSRRGPSNRRRNA